MTIADDGDVMTMEEIVAVYQGRNADATRALYARLREVGHAGVVAVNLLRVARNSAMARTCAFVWMVINGREARTEEESHGGAEDGTEGGAGEGAAGSAAAGSAGWSKDRQGALDI